MDKKKIRKDFRICCSYAESVYDYTPLWAPSFVPWTFVRSQALPKSEQDINIRRHKFSAMELATYEPFYSVTHLHPQRNRKYVKVSKNAQSTPCGRGELKELRDDKYSFSTSDAGAWMDPKSLPPPPIRTNEQFSCENGNSPLTSSSFVVARYVYDACVFGWVGERV